MIQQLIAGILRHVLTVLGGSLVTQGYLDSDQLTAGIGAILTLVGIAWSVWQKYKARTKPGGEFNPSQVRTATPAQPEAKFQVTPAAKRALNPNNKGFIELGVLLRLLLIVAVVAAFFLIGKAFAEPPGSWTINYQASPIVFSQREDQRPFWLRLVSSVGLWTEAGRDTRWRFDEYGLRAKGEDAQGRLSVDIGDVAVGMKFGTDF